MTYQFKCVPLMENTKMRGIVCTAYLCNAKGITLIRL